ncbi:MAG: hypothetical protein ACXACI_01650 [Candidatus Hodarchaeales archaeon]|jgi:predicted  nucleic acid-binding Zn-ribbon protein
MDERADRHKTRLDDIDAKISALAEQVRKTSDKSEIAAFEAEITKLKEERELRLAILDLKEKQSAAGE